MSYIENLSIVHLIFFICKNKVIIESIILIYPPFLARYWIAGSCI